MGSLDEMASLDLACSCGCCSLAVSNDDKDESICFSKATEGSCFSEAADSSNQGHDSDSEIGQVLHSSRASSVVGSDCILDVESGDDEVRISIGTMERECRICMLSLNSESAIELGCSCKNELAAVHQCCAEQWFRSKGNKSQLGDYWRCSKICEICKSIAQNVIVPSDTEPRQKIIEVNRLLSNAVSESVVELDTFSSNAVSGPGSSTSESRACFRCQTWIPCLLIFLSLLLWILDMMNII